MRILKQGVLAAFLATVLPGLAFAGTYDASPSSPTYAAGWNGQGLSGGFGTTPASLSSALASGDLTIEVKFKISENPTETQVLMGQTSFGWIGIGTAGNIQFTNNGDQVTQQNISGPTVTDGQWHTATLVLHPVQSGDTQAIMVGYLDGVQSGVLTPSAMQMPNPSLGFGIGSFEAAQNQIAPGTVIDEVSFWNNARNWSNFTPIDTPYQGIENGLVALYHLNGDLTDSVTSHVETDTAGNDGPVYFSPYNWAKNVYGTHSINAGAYLKTTYTGGQCSITLNPEVNKIFNTPSEIEVSVDGLPGKIYPVGQDSLPCSPDPRMATNQHSLRVAIKSTTETATRWSTVPDTVVTVRGINIGAGQSFSSPKVYPRTLLFYGDSITEGVRTLGETQPLDTDRNDNAVEWSAQVAQRLNAEYGIVGFGATGLTVSGSGGVPALTSAWNQIYPGQSRSFSSCPTAMIENEGTNDGSAAASDVQTAETTFLNAFSAMCPSSKLIVMRPFNGAQWSALQASVASLPGKNISLLDTTGFMNTAMGVDGLGLHPTANNAVNYLAPQVATAVRQIIEAQPSQTYTFR
ncbi:LamG-like jellyroll fold domain-containing protein [Gluconobacter japonicus]|uniref:LamG-like jellyroll fold domain-containing protein n=1 Tax=Gluconobacter japonicus TaxID=376620 RepID=UPI00078147D6|nr:LamG-like jellyroll fold domain-containing protein [Gluconobacter japonicus]KXV20055.1 hypothetical protein AD935_13380 [Gluconobacter japonicus]